MGKFGSLGLQTETTARMTILDHAGLPIRDKDGNEAWIQLRSTDSEAARKHDVEQRRRRLERASRRGAAKTSVEEIDNSTNELYAVLTVGWNLIDPVTHEKIDVPFNIANAREFYADPAMLFIREQVDAFVVDRANFVKASSTSS